METLIERGCGLDVHKKSVAACVMRFPEPKGTRQSHVRTFGTMAAELAALREWLESQEVTPVAMEHRGCNGSPCGPCSRRPSPACWSTRPTSSSGGASSRWTRRAGDAPRGPAARVLGLPRDAPAGGLSASDRRTAA